MEPLSALRDRFAQPDAAALVERQYQQLLDAYRPGGDSAGNIDLNKRPVVRNPDGSISTVSSMSANIDGRETLLPTISPGGERLSNDAAIAQYRDTGQHLGKFDDVPQADAYAQALHEQQAKQYSRPGYLDWSGAGAALPENIGRGRIMDPLVNMAVGAATLPFRAIDAAKTDVEHYRTHGMDTEYPPQAVGPAAETAMLLAGNPFAGVEAKAGEMVLGAGRTGKRPPPRPPVEDIPPPPIGHNNPPEAILPGDKRVSTRFPTAVKRTEDPLTHHLSIGTDEMRADPKNFERNTALLGDYPGFAKLKGMSPDEAAAGYIDQAKGNLNYLYDRSPSEMRLRSPRWYEGANEISDALARRWGIPRQSASAALASLSPQKDWFMNASLGERVGDIVTSNPKTTPDMMSWLRGNEKFMEGPGAEEMVRSLEGKKVSAMDPKQSAVAVRAYDQAHNTRNYRSILPEGYFGDWIRTQKGEPADAAWGTFGDISKAVRAIQSGGDMNAISPLLGNKHKVRSFYNNIEVPFDARYGDITGDTHQVAAGQMRPLSGTAEAVTQHLASGGAAGAANAGSSAVSGVQGTYGLIADATRQFAKERGMLAREGQSATWEPVRELFTRGFKNDKNSALIDDIWKAHDAGQLTLEQARDAVFKTAGGIGVPEWGRPGIRATSPVLGSTYR